MNNTTMICDFGGPSVPRLVIDAFSILLCACCIWLQGVELVIHFIFRAKREIYVVFMVIRTMAELMYATGLSSISLVIFVQGLFAEYTLIPFSACNILMIALRAGFTISIFQDFMLSVVASYSVMFKASWVHNCMTQTNAVYWNPWNATVVFMAMATAALVLGGRVSVAILSGNNGPTVCNVLLGSIVPAEDTLLLIVIVIKFLLDFVYIFRTKVYYSYSKKLSHFRMLNEESRYKLISHQRRFLILSGLASVCPLLSRGTCLICRVTETNPGYSTIIAILPIANALITLLLRTRIHRRFGIQFSIALRAWCGLRCGILLSTRGKDNRRQVEFPVRSDASTEAPHPSHKTKLTDSRTTNNVGMEESDLNLYPFEHFLMEQLRMSCTMGFVSTRKAMDLFRTTMSRMIEEAERKKIEANNEVLLSATGLELQPLQPLPVISRLATDPSYDISLSRMILTDVILGSGAYGAVTLGYIKMERSSEKLAVAIKSPLEGMALIHREALQKEISIMVYLGGHINVIRLLGTILDSGRLCAVLEYCDYGSLKSYLTDRRMSYYPWQGSSIDVVPQVATESGDIPSGYVSPLQRRDSGERVTEVDLLFYAYQIACGMEFLAAKNIIHRDVALRNMLLTDLYIVKVSDFGLSRRHAVSHGGNQLVPFKWYPPEAIIHEDYSRADIWSFGIVVWEVFSMGRDPSPHMESAFELLQAYSDGWRLEAPNNCPEEAYDVMCQCWSFSKSNRPSFQECIRQLSALGARISTRSA